MVTSEEPIKTIKREGFGTIIAVILFSSYLLIIVDNKLIIFFIMFILVLLGLSESKKRLLVFNNRLEFNTNIFYSATITDWKDVKKIVFNDYYYKGTSLFIEIHYLNKNGAEKKFSIEISEQDFYDLMNIIKDKNIKPEIKGRFKELKIK